MSNGSRALVGKSAAFGEEAASAPLTVGAFCAIFRAKPEADARYLRHFFESNIFKRQVDVVLAGSAINNLNVGQVLQFQATFPAKQVQRHIAELLSASDDEIWAVEAEIVKRKLHFVGVQRALLSCASIDASEVDDVLLKELVPTVQYGISTSLEPSGVIPVLRMNNLGAGEVDVSDLKYSPRMVRPELLLKDGDVLFNRTNSMEHVGRTSIWRSQLDEATFASYLVRLFPDESRITKAYLVYLLGWEEHQSQMRRYATPGVQQVNINPTNLRLCRVQVPRSLKVQQRAVEALDACREYIAALQAEVEKLRLQKRGLAMDLLAGAGGAST